MHVPIINGKKEAMNFKERKSGYIKGFGEEIDEYILIHKINVTTYP